MSNFYRATPLTSVGYEQVTGIGAAKGLTIPSGGAKQILIQCTGQNVRWRDDGTDPTAAIGMQLVAGETIMLSSASLPKLRIIEESATAVVNVTYYA